VPPKVSRRELEKACYWELFGTKTLTTAAVADALGQSVETTYQKLVNFEKCGWVSKVSAIPKQPSQLPDVQWSWTPADNQIIEGI